MRARQQQRTTTRDAISPYLVLQVWLWSVIRPLAWFVSYKSNGEGENVLWYVSVCVGLGVWCGG